MNAPRSFFYFLLLLVLNLGLAGSQARAESIEALRAMPVQDGGRIKPFDTFARESLYLIYGHETFRPEKGGSARPASEIVMTWILQPSAWEETPLFEIRHGEVKKGLRLSEEKKHFSFREIMNSDRLPTLMQELQSHRETKEKLNPYFQALQRLENQLFTFREIAAGRMLRLVPPKTGETWQSLPELDGALQSQFVEISQAFIRVLGTVTGNATAEEKNQTQKILTEKIKNFETSAQAENPVLYAQGSKIQTEIHYYDFHPFRWAWIVYLICALTCLIAWAFEKPSFYRPAWLLGFVGLALHIYGFSLRVYLMGRPPVSNMYETVVWVGFGAVVFSMAIEAVYRWRFILLAGTLAGAFCLMLADMAPVVLDPSLQPLEPVLRSNFWLMIHVMTITISYAAFFLSFVLGNIGLIYFLGGESKNRDKIKAVTLALYRGMQIGVSFLAPGIILGGIWADYSWGRFWGWDPKETWALIVVLGYLAVLHGRLVGMIKDFGMNVAAVMAFSLVIMAWYGVNFVLGAGLHSYGFGAGGVEYVAGFLAVEILFVVFASVVRFGRLKASKENK
ncbi:MAG: cytochrome C biogenesis protein [Bdellovibrio sp. CG10_big_fil_rev_8_21_14_0_10_47_8]|nr:MAG: cytochrome C biogenesis protein [Bdellovibrio sp. CG10_big_fil_rev_8_21_14_0_10_47_8]